MTRTRVLAATLLLAAAIPETAASDGLVDIGYGVKAKGMGGAGVAYAQDALAPATNPAGLAFIGNRIDGGAACRMADRSGSLGGTTYDGNDGGPDWLAEAGWRHAIDGTVAVGLAIYSDSIETRYDRAIPAFGTTRTGFDLERLYIAPTLSVEVARGHALGVSLVVAYQRCEATGLQNFGIDDPGYDGSAGAGFRIGYSGIATDWLSLGATLQSRMHMSRFDAYDGLFAQHGELDIPASYAVGLALTPFHGTTVAVDVERILYSSVAALGNGMDASNIMKLGADDGPGFGWADVTVYKLGIDQVIGRGLSLRAGYNHCSQPVQADQTYLNMLMPAVARDHLTLGATLQLSSAIEISAFYGHAFANTVTGSGNVLGLDADLTMSQDMYGVGLGWTR